MRIASKILGVGAYVPPRIVKNEDLEKLMDTSDEWITQRTGIKERRWVDEETTTSDLALKASLQALENAKISKDQIDMIIFATLSPDHDFPGTGVFLQEKLGLHGLPVFDIRQQCSGFIYGMSMADTYISSGRYHNILLVGAEVHSKTLDKTPRGRNVSVLFGDGAGAVVLSKTEVNDPSQDSHIMYTELHADGHYAKELWLPGPGNALGAERITPTMFEEGLLYPQMNGKLVFTHAVKKMAESLQNSCQKVGITPQDIDCFLFHQANMRINSKVAELLDIDESKVFNTIQKYGNTTAATIPLGMRDAIDANFLKKGMTVASAAFGSGFTWASAIYRF